MQDRHARGDERHFIFAAHRLPVALSAADSLPPHSTVYKIFRKFHRDGTWKAIWAELHMALRERMGREASPFSTASRSNRQKKGQ